MIRGPSVVVLLCAIALSGCTDSSDGSAATTTSSAAAATTSSAAAATSTTSSSTTTTTSAPRPPTTFEKDIKDNDFPQGTFTVQRGDTARWTHRGNAPHSVTANDGSFDSSPQCPTVPALCMLSGQTFSYTFDALGEFSYYCKVHSTMTGTVTVVAVAP